MSKISELKLGKEKKNEKKEIEKNMYLQYMLINFSILLQIGKTKLLSLPRMQKLYSVLPTFHVQGENSS